jgi:NAD(P)-dependent dehydrogenase (short-subunit alcohol dehydrogenase family)
MESFEGKLAVVTGGGSGMGRELVVQLAAEGCSIATCDLNEPALAETAALAATGTRITTHSCDVSKESSVDQFRDEVMGQHETGHVNLLFNNAGIGGGESFVAGDRESWDRTFAVCWGGVYNCTRAFLPLLVAADDGFIVNTSSVNGFLASGGTGVPSTAYSTAKFAVKGFSEALIDDLRANAPHVKVAVVMPGHVGTDIVLNTILGDGVLDAMSIAELARFRANLERMSLLPEDADDGDLRDLVGVLSEGFRTNAPTSAAGAATAILDGVRAGRWRILVGEDAHRLDEAVRADPEGAYGPDGPHISRRWIDELFERRRGDAERPKHSS